VLKIEIASFVEVWGGYQLCERSATEKVGSGRKQGLRLSKNVQSHAEKLRTLWEWGVERARKE
jgi:hypothetical protein